MEDHDTQRKVNAMKHKKKIFLRDKKDARPNLTVKVLKRMHLDMKHGSFADMSAECKRLGGTRKYRNVLHVHTEAQTLQQVKLSKKIHCLTKTSSHSGEG